MPCRSRVSTSACGVSSGPCRKDLGTWYFLEKWEEQGGLTGAQAEQEASLSPRPGEIPERGQLAELRFPVVSRVLQELLPTGAAPPSGLREVGWPFVGSPGGGMWFLLQVPVVPAPHPGSTPKAHPTSGAEHPGEGPPQPGLPVPIP